MSKTARERVRQWYDGTLYSRLDSKKEDVIVLIMQRLHLDDLAGVLRFQVNKAIQISDTVDQAVYWTLYQILDFPRC